LRACPLAPLLLLFLCGDKVREEVFAAT